MNEDTTELLLPENELTRNLLESLREDEHRLCKGRGLV